MTEQLKPCPFCGGTFVAHGVDGKDMVSVWCKCGARGPDYGFDVFNGTDDINLAYNGWNTRPSASREIAVKPLKWVKDPKNVSFVNAEYVDTFDLYCIAERVLFIGHTETGIPFATVKEAKAAAQADYERRILSALDTTPGNTDPIAKYDDELRKVQGGWRDFWDWWSEDGCAIDTDPDVSWYDKRRDFAEIAFEAGRISAPTEHPTEQPSVRAGAVDAVVYEARFLVDRLKEYEADGCQCDESVRQWNGHVSAPLERLEMALSDATGPTEHPTEQTSVRDAALIRSRAIKEFCEAAGIKASVQVAHLPDDVRRVRAQAALDQKLALRSLAQEGEG